MAGTRILLSIIHAAFLALPLSGFGSDDPPEISLTTTCLNGLTVVTVRNTGGAMTEAGLFEAVFADGERDTLHIRAGAGATATCQLAISMAG